MFFFGHPKFAVSDTFFPDTHRLCLASQLGLRMNPSTALMRKACCFFLIFAVGSKGMIYLPTWMVDFLR